MKRCLLFLLSALTAAAQTTVEFNSIDFAAVAQGKVLTITPTSTPILWDGRIVQGGPLTVAPTNGLATISLVPHTYRVSWAGLSSPLTIQVPDVQTNVPANAIIVTGTNASGIVAYSTTVSDARFQMAAENLTNWASLSTNVIVSGGLQYIPQPSSANLTNWSALSTNAIGTGGGTGGGDASGAETDIRLAIPGPHGNLRGLTHPNLVRVHGGFGGYEYWLTFSGTTNQTAEPFGPLTEDIFVRGSSDLINWSAGQESQLMSREEFQAVAANGWLADPELYHDTGAGLLRCLWAGFRVAGANGYQQWLYTAHSADGATWSTPELLRTWYASNDIPGTVSTNAPAAGPQIVTLADGSLRLYAVDEGNYSGGTNALWFVPGLDASGTNWDWATRTICTLDTFSSDTSLPWHFDLTLVDGTYYMIYGSQTTDLWGEYTTSADGITWDTPWLGSLVDQKLWQSTNRLYKVAWLPVAGRDGLAWNMILGKAGPTTNPGADQWQLGTVRNWQPNFQEMSRAAKSTNWWVEGSEKILQLAGVTRPAQRTFYERLSASAGGMVSIGAAESGSGAVVFGTGAATNVSGSTGGGTPLIRNSGTNFLLLHTSADGGIQLRQSSGIRAGIGTNGGFFVGSVADTTSPVGTLNVQSNLIVAGTITGDGSGLTLLDANQLKAGGATIVIVPPQHIPGAFSNTLVFGTGGALLTTNPPYSLDPLPFEQDGSHAGQDNTFLGIEAGFENTSGAGNTFVGSEAGEDNTTGTQNTFLGWAAGRSNRRGYHNTFVGVGAGQENGDNFYNTFMGTDTGLRFTNGNLNVFLGTGSGGGGAEGSRNVYVGVNTGNSAAGNDNVFVGTYSGTSGAGGSGNVGVGANSLQMLDGGTNNTSVGYLAGLNTTTANENTSLGYQALTANTTGGNNVAVGGEAMKRQTTGTHNAGLGHSVMANLNTGIQNTAVGSFAGSGITNGTQITAVGYQALFAMSGGTNTALGWRAGVTPKSGAYNLFLGSGADCLDSVATNLQNAIAIGHNAVVTNSNQTVIGNTNTTNTIIYGAVTGTGGFVGIVPANLATNAPTAGQMLYTTSTNSAKWDAAPTGGGDPDDAWTNIVSSGIYALAGPDSDDLSFIGEGETNLVVYFGAGNGIWTPKINLSALATNAPEANKILYSTSTNTAKWDDPPTGETVEGTDVLSTAESAGKVLTADGSGGASWAAASGGGLTNVSETASAVSVSTNLNVSGTTTGTNFNLRGDIIAYSGATSNVLQIAADSPGLVDAKGAWYFLDARGNAANLTNLAAANLTGTLPMGVLTTTGTNLSGAMLTQTNGARAYTFDAGALSNLNASALFSGTVPIARMPAGVGRVDIQSVELFEDFHHGFYPAWNAGAVGPLGLVKNAAGTGAAIAATTGSTNAPGVVRLTTGTVTNGFAFLYSADNGIRLGGGGYTNVFRFRVNELPNATNTYTGYIGISDGSSAIGVDVVQLTWGTNNSNFQFITRNNNSESRATNGTAVVAGTWYTATIAVDDTAANAYLTIGAESNTLSSNIPSASGRETELFNASIIKTQGTTAATFDIDYLITRYAVTR